MFIYTDIYMLSGCQQSTLGHSPGNSLTHPMLLIASNIYLTLRSQEPFDTFATP